MIDLVDLLSINLISQLVFIWCIICEIIEDQPKTNCAKMTKFKNNLIKFSDKCLGNNRSSILVVIFIHQLVIIQAKKKTRNYFKIMAKLRSQLFHVFEFIMT